MAKHGQSDATRLEGLALGARGRWGRPFRRWAWKRLADRRMQAAIAAYGHDPTWRRIVLGEDAPAGEVIPFKRKANP